MNTKQLEAFVYVAEEKNFTKAAKLLFMTQPAISFQIKALEEEFGLSLFERMDKKVFLTEGGKILYPEAKKILALFEAVKDGISALKGLERGSLVIGASTIPGEYILPKIIGKFKEKFPGLLIALEISGTGDIIEKLEARSIDIAIVGAKPEEKHLDTFELTDDELILIGPNNNPRTEIALSELHTIPFIFREQGSGTRKIIEQHLRALGYQLNMLTVLMEIGSTRAIISAVEAGLGFSFISQFAAKEALELKKIKAIAINNFSIRRRFYGVVNPQKYNSNVINVFQQFIKENLPNIT